MLTLLRPLHDWGVRSIRSPCRQKTGSLMASQAQRTAVNPDTNVFSQISGGAFAHESTHTTSQRLTWGSEGWPEPVSVPGRDGHYGGLTDGCIVRRHSETQSPGRTRRCSPDSDNRLFIRSSLPAAFDRNSALDGDAHGRHWRQRSWHGCVESDSSGRIETSPCLCVELRQGTYLDAQRMLPGDKDDLRFSLAEDSLARGSPARLPTPSHLC